MINPSSEIDHGAYRYRYTPHTFIDGKKWSAGTGMEYGATTSYVNITGSALESGGKEVTVLLWRWDKKNETGTYVDEVKKDIPPRRPSFAVTVPAGVPPCIVSCNRVYKVPLLPLYIMDPLWSPLYESCISPPCSITFALDEKHIGDKFGIGALIAGASISMLGEKEVYELTEGTTHVTVPSLHMAPINLIICNKFGVSDAECDFWIASWVLDPLFLAEEIMIVKEGKNLAGEPVTATNLDKALIFVATAGIVTPGFSEGMVLKHFKELIRLSKGSDEFAILLKTQDVANFLSMASYAKIKTFTSLVRGGKFDDALKLVDNLPELTPKNADWVVKRYDKWYELLGKGLGKKKATEVIVKHGISKKLKAVIVGTAAIIAGLTFKQVLVMWFMVDNMPFYIYMWLKWHGKGPGDIGYDAARKGDLVNTDAFAVRDDLDLGFHDLAREKIILYEEHLNEFKTFIDDNADSLKRSNDYETSYGEYETFTGVLKTLKIQAGVITWPEEFKATVRHARDGDSFEIEYVMAGESRRIDVRIVGINTPEMRDTKGDIKCTTSPITRVPAEYSDRAKSTVSVLEDEIVTIQLDLTHIYDPHNRLLARVIDSGGSDVGLEQLNKGLACYYFREVHKWVDDAKYKAAEAAAKKGNIGIWSLPPPDVGKIRCISSPSNAVIYLDDDDDPTPYRTTHTIDDIAVGAHTLMFKESTKCKDCFCEKRVFVIKDDTVDAYCKLSAIYEIRQPYFYKGDKKEDTDPYIYIDGKKTEKRAGPHTIIHFGTDIDDNVLRFGTAFGGRECGFGTHTIELRFVGFKTVKETKKFDPGDFFSITPEMQEGEGKEEVKPTPTPVPGEPITPVEEDTGELHIGHAFDKNTGEQISTGSNKFPLFVLKDGVKCDCRCYIDEDLVFGDGKFCNRKDDLCPLPLGTHTFVIERKNYEDFEFTVTINAGDKIHAPKINMIPKSAAMSGVTDLEQSIIPAEIYLETSAPFAIAVKNTGAVAASYQTRVEFYGEDTDNLFSFESEWSKETPPGEFAETHIHVTLPAEAIPVEKDEAIYSISTVLKAK